MGIIDEIQILKSRGLDENQIFNELQKKGITPRQISDALDRTQVKEAVTGGRANMEQDLEVPSFEEAPQEDFPQTEEIPSPQNNNQTDNYYDNSYQGYSQYPSQDADTIIEIAEQVFSEKISKIRHKIDDLNEFKVISQTKLEHIEHRLKKIEEVIDKIYSSVLDKIGSYGKEIGPIRKEMEMMQDSFSKMINPIAENSKRKVSTKKKISKK